VVDFFQSSSIKKAYLILMMLVLTLFVQGTELLQKIYSYYSGESSVGRTIQSPTGRFKLSEILFTFLFLFQNKVLRNMVNTPWYFRNNDLHRDLLVDAVTSEIQRFAQKHEGRLHRHENTEVLQLLDNMVIVHRLQRRKTL
jgi:hypothetical protein